MVPIQLSKPRRKNNMTFRKEILTLYAVTDRSWLKGASLAEHVEQALQGGITFLQLREKHLSDEEMLHEATEIRDLCRKYNVPFVINDRVDIALRSGADGVHVGQSDMEASNARMLLGPDRILGVTANTVEAALRAEKAGADYLGVGAVFTTSSKDDARPVSRETFQAICDAVHIPVVAIGGINAANILSLKGLPASGVAVISAVFAQNDIRAAAENMLALSRKMLVSSAHMSVKNGVNE